MNKSRSRLFSPRVSSATQQLLISCFLLGSLQSSEVSKTRFTLSIPAPTDSAGGLLVADVDSDGHQDLLISVPGHFAAYSSKGKEIATFKTNLVVGGQSESQGLPGHNGPGLACGDVDLDGKNEIVYLTLDGWLHVLDGKSKKWKASVKPPVPQGASRWELAMLADFQGTGKDQDILLQATNKKGYRTGRYLAAYKIKDLLNGAPALWTTDRFVSCAHNGARLVDLDGDHKDEILGSTIFNWAGKKVVEAVPYRGHMDSVFAADVLPGKKGLEVILLEEGSNHVQILSLDGLVWRKANQGAQGRGREPQNAAIGRFLPGSTEVFVWCRSRNQKHQTPFVFNSKGQITHRYELDKIKPKGWTDSGVEVIHTIDWTGKENQLACAKERHTEGDVGIFEPLTGKFVEHFKEKADRLYVADIQGDWREEVIVLSGKTVTIYQNKAPNPRPHQPRLWENRNYRRLKQCHNYYSP